jgi:K+-transporting ATPase ATPase C chain
MKIIKNIAQVTLFFAFMTIITGVFYPLLITGLARLLFYEKSLGSLIRENENMRGSVLIAQNFSADYYFWPRPSARNFSAYPSEASNLGPTSKKLKDLVKARRIYLGEIINIPESLLTSSGSGLDPHISFSAANFQRSRVIKARALNKAQERELEEIITKNLEHSWFLAQQEPYINVLLLNLALDHSFGRINS